MLTLVKALSPCIKKVRPYGLSQFLSLLLVFTASSALDAAPDALLGPNSGAWRFKVFLNDKEIGYHTFELSEADDHQVLKTEANFKVKFLFVTAFKYQHNNTEIWKNGCLEQISSKTQSNGKRFVVNGKRTGTGFSLTTNNVHQQLGSCVMTFAYWNSNFLKQTHLLNSQTGKMMKVSVNPVTDPVEHSKPSQYQYKVTGKKLDLDVWYSMEHQWLGLESVLKKGRKLRYVLMEE